MCVAIGLHPDCKRAIKGLKLHLIGFSFQKTSLFGSGFWGARVGARSPGGRFCICAGEQRGWTYEIDDSIGNRVKEVLGVEATRLGGGLVMSGWWMADNWLTG